MRSGTTSFHSAMLVVTGEHSGQTVKFFVRESGVARPYLEGRVYSAAVFQDYMEDWKRLYQRAESLRGIVDVHSELIGKIRKKGRVLAALIFGRKLLRSLPRGPILISVDPALSALPYEILHNDRGFVADQYPIIRDMVAYREPKRRSKFHKPVISGRALILSEENYSHAVTTSVHRERNELVSVFKGAGVADIRTVRVEGNTLKLLEELSEARFVHYAGHFPSAHIDVSLAAIEISRMDLTAVQTVFLNGCQSADRGMDGNKTFRKLCAKQAFRISWALGFRSIRNGPNSLRESSGPMCVGDCRSPMQ